MTCRDDVGRGRGAAPLSEGDGDSAAQSNTPRGTAARARRGRMPRPDAVRAKRASWCNQRAALAWIIKHLADYDNRRVEGRQPYHKRARTTDTTSSQATPSEYSESVAALSSTTMVSFWPPRTSLFPMPLDPAAAATLPHLAVLSNSSPPVVLRSLAAPVTDSAPATSDS
jgi:hypothetical protein